MANVSSSNGLEKRPKLRFPGFDGAWDFVQLSDIASYRRARKTAVKSEYVSTENMLQEFSGMEAYCDSSVIEGIAYFTGDTLIANIRPYLKKVWFATMNGVCSADVLAIQPIKVYPEFLYNMIAQDAFIEYVMSGAKGSKMPRGDKSHIMYYKTAIPKCDDEQIKIAQFLHLLTLRITKMQLLIDFLKKYKRGVFEMVFSQKVRLIPKSKRKNWQHYKLSDFTTRVTRKNGGQSDIPLTISAQYGLIDQRDFFSKTIASADMSGYYLLRSGEYAYNRSTSNDYPFGSIKRLELYPMGAVSTLYLCFRVKDDIVLSDLAKWYFESSQWHRGVNEICAEGARNHGLLNVPTDGFFNTVHTLPSDPEEQLAIASYLSLFQARLDSAQAVLEKLLRIRSGLMQRLFI